MIRILKILFHIIVAIGSICLGYDGTRLLLRCWSIEASYSTKVVIVLLIALLISECVRCLFLNISKLYSDHVKKKLDTMEEV